MEAIERLRRSRSSFVFGMKPSTECFSMANGGIGGFAALLCDWLSELFGIRFTPVICEWDELSRGLASHSIDFTGDLSPFPERLKTFVMTSPIAVRSIKYMRLEGSKSLLEIEENIDAIDAELQAAQSLPLDREKHGEISRITELVLMADFKQAAALAGNLCGKAPEDMR
ncbi:MAG: hypothetical protein LBD82_02095 [Deltaproteobacteria bacterium]|nr:hypothetical protein [Deltaproteobacteria bacterium]